MSVLPLVVMADCVVVKIAVTPAFSHRHDEVRVSNHVLYRHKLELCNRIVLRDKGESRGLDVRDEDVLRYCSVKRGAPIVSKNF